MTANEMFFELEKQVDILSDESAPQISDEQGSSFLNEAVTFLVKYKIISEGVESSEYNRAFIAPLKRNTGESNFVSVKVDSPLNTQLHSFGEFWTLPDDLYVILQEECLIDKRDCHTGKLATLNILPISEDYYNLNIYNYEKKPYYNGSDRDGLVWRLYFNNNINNLDTNNKISELITDKTFNISQYNFRYLVRPRSIVVNNENPESQINSEIWEQFHMDIVNRAALIAIENMRLTARLQSKAGLNAQQNL